MTDEPYDGHRIERDDPPLTEEEQRRTPYPGYCIGAPTKRACLARGYCRREPTCVD